MNFKKVLSVLVIAFIGGIVALGVNRLMMNDDNSNRFTQHQNAKFTLAEKLAAVPEVDFVSVAEIATPAVVHIISTLKSSPRGQMINPFEEFFGGPSFPQQQGPQQATGSGVIIKQNGYIVILRTMYTSIDLLLSACLLLRYSYRISVICFF